MERLRGHQPFDKAGHRHDPASGHYHDPHGFEGVGGPFDDCLESLIRQITQLTVSLRQFVYDLPEVVAVDVPAFKI